jgi:hypothetical protein
MRHPFFSAPCKSPSPVRAIFWTFWLFTVCPLGCIIAAAALHLDESLRIHLAPLGGWPVIINRADRVSALSTLGLTVTCIVMGRWEDRLRLLGLPAIIFWLCYFAIPRFS